VGGMQACSFWNWRDLGLELIFFNVGLAKNKFGDSVSVFGPISFIKVYQCSLSRANERLFVIFALLV
jgi:hypothetical protein